MRRFAVRAAAALAFASAAAAVLAQQSQQPTFRTDIDVVQLDVTVLDRNRKPIRGLTAADFTVLEDGKPRSIVGVLPVDLPPPPPLEAVPWTRDVAPDVISNDIKAQRLVIIIMDDAKTGINASPSAAGGPNYDPHIALYAKRIARDVIASLGPQDLAAVVFTYRGRRQNLTTDRAKLLASVDSFMARDMPNGRVPLGCGSRGPIGDCVIDAFQNVANALPPTSHRKIVVFIGQNFSAIDGACGVGVDLAAPGVSVKTDAIKVALRKLQQANVTIYSFDPAGLQNDAAQFCKAGNLRVLAEITGGRSTSQTNTPWVAVPAVLEETSSYYLVGFRTDRTDGQFHTVSVRVNRPNVEVRTRQGYVAPGGKPPKLKKGVAPPTPIERALASSIPNGDLSFTASAVVIPEPGRKDAAVSVLSHIRVPDIDAPLPRHLEVLVTAFDKDWKDKGSHRQTAELDGRGTPGGLTEIDVRSYLRLLPGRYELRVAADSGVLTGNLFTDLEVPDITKEALSLSSLVLAIADPVQPAAAPAASSSPLPSVRRDYAATDRVTAFLRVAQGGKKPTVAISMNIRIEDVHGVKPVDERVDMAALRFVDRSLDYRYELPLVRLVPGEYLLTMTATLGKREVTRAVRFSRR